MRLLFRFYDAQEGTIAIGGTPIVQLQLNSLRQSIGIVPQVCQISLCSFSSFHPFVQDCVLFHNTLYYNIAYGRPDATHEEVIAASKAAGLHESVMRMPMAYETR